MGAITRATISGFVRVHRARNDGLEKSVLSETSCVVRYIRFVRNHSPRAMERCGRGLGLHVGRLLNSTTMSRRELLGRTTVCTSGVTISRRAMELHDRVSRLHRFVGSDRTVNEGLSFLIRRVGHRTGAVNSGTRSISVTGGIVTVGTRIRGVHRRIRGVR